MKEHEAGDEPSNRHDILDVAEGGYIAISRPKDSPPLTASEQDAFRELAALALHRRRPSSS